MLQNVMNYDRQGEEHKRVADKGVTDIGVCMRERLREGKPPRDRGSERYLSRPSCLVLLSDLGPDPLRPLCYEIISVLSFFRWGRMHCVLHLLPSFSCCSWSLCQHRKKKRDDRWGFTSETVSTYRISYM